MKTGRASLPCLISLLILSFTAAGCGLSVEAEIPEVQVTQHDLLFEGVAMASLAGDVSMSRSFSRMHERLELPDGLDAQVQALGVSLEAKSGVQDLGFIKSLRLVMNDGVDPAVEVLDYQRAADAAASRVLTMTSANPVNTLDQWKTDSATFTLEVAGPLPADAWTVDLTIRFAGRAHYKY